jgi:tyrosine-protein kinase Etk/Wzc
MNLPGNGSPEETSGDGFPSYIIQDYISTVLRGKWIILTSFGLILTAMIVYTLLTKNVYESSSLVLINVRQVGTPFSINDAGRTPSENKIANELGQLKTHVVAEAVAWKLLRDPYADDAKKDLLPAVVARAGENDTSNALATLAQVTARVRRAMDFIPERESDEIRIIARSGDPREAAILANTYADVYQEYAVSSSRSRSKSRREFLQSQVNSKKRTLDSTENAMKSYMQASGVVSLDAQAERVTQQLSQLEASRDAIDIDLESLTRTLETYQTRLPEQEKEVVRVMKTANDPYIRLIQDQLATLQVQRDVLANPTNSGVGKEIFAEKLKGIEAQIANLQKKLDDRTMSYLQTLPSGETGAAQTDPAGYLVQAKQKIFETQMQIQALQAKKTALNNVIKEYEVNFSGIPRKSIELANLQRARLSAEKLYLLVEERYNEAAIGEKSDFGYIDIIDTAVVPGVPVSPNFWMNVMLGIFFGLGTGFVIVFVRDHIDVRINTPEDLKRRGYPLLAFVPRMGTQGPPGEGKPAKVAFEGKEYPETLVSLLEPFSPAAESYRRLRSKLEFTLPEERTRKIVVTSPNPGEGKTTTVANLGIALAQAERRVLIVDADLRRPSLHEIFGLENVPGLSEVLSDQVTLQKAIRPNFIRGLDILCAGEPSPKGAELLGSRHMVKFLKELNQTYDWVLMDTSPVLPVSDAATLSAMTDGLVVVVSGGETRVLTLERAVELLAGNGAKLAGVFLNNFNARNAYGRFYGSDRYGYYNAAYGASSGKNGTNGEKKGAARVAAKFAEYSSRIKSHSTGSE